MDEVGAVGGWTGSTGRRVLRGILTLAAVVGLVYMLLIATVIGTIKCGDSCDSAADPGHWRWTVQFVLAAVGSALGTVALALGFTSKTAAHRVLLLLSTGCVLTWVIWVLGLGAF